MDERTQLAAEPHDHLAQNLTAISYQNSGGRAFAHCRCSRLRAEADAVALRRHLLKR